MSASGTGRTLGLPHDVASRESAEDSALVGISDEEEGNEGLEDTRLRSLHRTGLGSSRRFHSPSPLLDDRSQAFSASQCLRSLSRSGGHRSIKSRPERFVVSQVGSPPRVRQKAGSLH
eukprot:g15118.t1